MNPKEAKQRQITKRHLLAGVICSIALIVLVGLWGTRLYKSIAFRLASVVATKVVLPTPDPTTNPSAVSGPVLVGFGDSITAGRGASDPSHRWVNIVAAGLGGYTLVNSGANSTVLQNTIQNSIQTVGRAAENNGQDTLVSRVIVYHPSLVLVLYGLNDMRLNDPAFTAATFQASLSDVVSSMISSGISADRIILASPPFISDYSSYGPPFNAGSVIKHQEYRNIISAVASTKGTRFIDVYQWMADHGGAQLLDPDGVHPNDKGHQAIADAFLNTLNNNR
jgi:lysophospholipase L1-like esterase